MRPRAASSTPGQRPGPASMALPPLHADASTVDAVGATARAYAAEVVASRPGVRQAYIARLAFDFLAERARLVSAPVSPGRWSNRPPAAGVAEARRRLDPPQLRTPVTRPAVAPF